MGNESKKIVKIVRNVMPSVVSIVLSKKLEELESELNKENAQQGKHHSPIHIPLEKIDARGMVEVGGGSGFIVDATGIILTNKHVIEETNVEYTVITNDDTHYSAEILACDPVDDVAILKINPTKKLPEVTLGDSTQVELGQTALAFGNALGIFKNTVSRGIISGLLRSVSAHAGASAPLQEMRGLIQTDAAINPGNSGGPLVDTHGRVVGINAAVVAGAENIGFAIPINTARRDLQDVKKYGRVRRPLLGIRYLTITPDFKEKFKLSVDYGALVTREYPKDLAVVVGSPADIAGIREDDIVLRWNGKKIETKKTIQDFLEDCNVGDIITLSLLRDGKEIETNVTLTERK
ncbi:MAG: trypsin-like peptidase domain-containing protein [Candidatus Paceibacterota bacterium]|jgi:S1-C subfamily serine protease